MATRVELDRDLDRVVAARFAQPAVNRAARRLAAAARDRAPAAKQWITAEDERVRPAHADADGQLVPANLRFKLRRQAYLPGSGRGSGSRPGHFPGRTVLTGGYDLAREPRDTALPADQVANCRCVAVELPDEIARRIQASRAVVDGTRVSARVSVEFPRIAESEYGTGGDRPAYFMRGALREVAARS